MVHASPGRADERADGRIEFPLRRCVRAPRRAVEVRVEPEHSNREVTRIPGSRIPDMIPSMNSHYLRLSMGLVLSVMAVGVLSAQQVTKKEIAGISTFAQVETTIACGGSTKPEAIREISKMGFKSVVNLRLASEEGALVEEEGAAVKAAGM